MSANALLSHRGRSSAGDPSTSSLYRLLVGCAEQRPHAPAILGPGRPPLSYLGLLEQAHDVGRTLARHGIGPDDRVALVLPNGPEAAVAFLAVACGAACAPLNPAYREAELDFFLGDARARAVVVPAGETTPARAAAKARGLIVLELQAEAGAEAGRFTLRGDANRPAGEPAFAEGEDVALVLHTSGTTARPKLVPLRHDALCAAAAGIRDSLALTEADRCLNVMPLFHLHALSVLLASVSAGAAVACVPPFDPAKFFGWLDAFAPTWWSASPTVHQAVLERAEAHADVIARRPVRLIRSTSGPLPTTTLAKLERTFAAPVIEAYAATEAPSLIASNPLPPRPRKPGSVGLVTGPEVAILGEGGEPLGPGRVGEVVLRGRHVLPAYENNPEANASAFVNGWFRTGDLGYFDADGYLFLTGRAKEIINKGGEKVAPREVEEALLASPAVAQAVAFAVPHPRLGEDVAAAVVLRAGQPQCAGELRRFAAQRLSDFKVPREIVFVGEIPKGPTGKVQRVGLAKKLGVCDVGGRGGGAGYVAPRTPAEEALAGLWAELLRVERVGVRDDFFLRGGDSLLAADLLVRIEKRFGKRLTPATLLEGATVECVARALGAAPRSAFTSLVPLQPRGARPPFYFVHGIGGELLSFAALARHWDADQPLYALRVRTVDGVARPFSCVEEMAAHYVEEVRRVQPAGPYHLGGYSFGGVVAFEMARQLVGRGEAVGLLVVVDSDARRIAPRRVSFDPGWLLRFLGNLPYWVLEDVVRAGPRALWGALCPKAKALARRAAHRVGLAPAPTALEAQGVFSVPSLGAGFREVLETHLRARLSYRPGPYPGRVTLLRARARPLLSRHAHDLGWGEVAAGGVAVRVVPGNHATLLHPPNLPRLVDRLLAQLREAQRTASPEGRG